MYGAKSRGFWWCCLPMSRNLGKIGQSQDIENLGNFIGLRVVHIGWLSGVLFILTLIGSELLLPINRCSPEASIARETYRSTNLFCLLPPTCPPHLRLSIHIYIPTPATSNSKQFNFPCTRNTYHNLSTWNDQHPVLGRLIASIWSHLSSACKCAKQPEDI